MADYHQRIVSSRQPTAFEISTTPHNQPGHPLYPPDAHLQTETPADFHRIDIWSA